MMVINRRRQAELMEPGSRRPGLDRVLGVGASRHHSPPPPLLSPDHNDSYAPHLFLLLWLRSTIHDWKRWMRMYDTRSIGHKLGKSHHHLALRCVRGRPSWLARIAHMLHANVADFQFGHRWAAAGCSCWWTADRKLL